MSSHASVSSSLQLLLSSSTWKAETEQRPRLGTQSKHNWFNEFKHYSMSSLDSTSAPTLKNLGDYALDGWIQTGRAFLSISRLMKHSGDNWKITYSFLIWATSSKRGGWKTMRTSCTKQPRSWRAFRFWRVSKTIWSNSSNWAETAIIANHIRSSSLIIYSWIEGSVEVLDKQVFRAVPTSTTAWESLFMYECQRIWHDGLESKTKFCSQGNHQKCEGMYWISVEQLYIYSIFSQALTFDIWSL